MYGMSPQTDRQDTKAGRQNAQRKEHCEKQSEERQREVKSEDNDLSSAWDLVVGFHRWGRYDVLLLLGSSHNGELRWSGGLRTRGENTEKRMKEKQMKGQCKKPRFNSILL